MARNLRNNRSISRRRNRVVRLPLREECGLAGPPEQELGMEAADLLRLYDRAVAGLSEKTRRVFLMHRVEERSNRAIYQRLGISIATVAYNMMKALDRIAQVVDQTVDRTDEQPAGKHYEGQGNYLGRQEN